MPRPLALGQVLLLAALTGCVDVERESGIVPLARTQLLARARVAAAAGGTVAPGADQGFDGVRVVIPPGALAEDTDIEIHVRFGDPRLPSVVQSFEIRPAGLRLAAPATIGVLYSEFYAATVAPLWHEGDIALYSFVAEVGEDERAHEVAQRDAERNLLETHTDRLGTFYCLHQPLRTLIAQPTRLVDPAVPLRATLVAGRPERSADGPLEVPIGKGSLASFWQSTADRNLLVLPGLLGDPLQIAGPGSFAPGTPQGGLNEDFDNVVVFQYPSGRSLRESANRLYDILLANAGPGFGCSVLAHGTGGLVARYAIERAHLDPERLGHAPEQPALDAIIPWVVFVGTPNQGAPAVQARFQSLLSALFASDVPFVQGLIDLAPAPDSFVATLNRGWDRPASRYFAIAGDVDGAQSDGLVDVISAVGVPQAFSRPDAHQVFNGPIYDHASLLVFANRTGVIDQAREWFEKSAGDAPPVVGSIRTPTGLGSGTIEIPLSISDAESRPCRLIALWSRDGRSWLPATPEGGWPLLLPSSPAPGEPVVFRWDSAADGAGLADAEQVTLRFLIADPGQIGTPGETGSFPVRN